MDLCATKNNTFYITFWQTQQIPTVLHIDTQLQYCLHPVPHSVTDRNITGDRKLHIYSPLMYRTTTTRAAHARQHHIIQKVKKIHEVQNTVSFEIMSWHLPGGTEQNHRNKSRYSVHWLRIICTSDIYIFQNRTAAVWQKIWYSNWTVPAGMWDGITVCLQEALLTPVIQICPLQNIQRSTGAQPHSYWTATRGSFPSILEAKNEWSCNSTPTTCTETLYLFHY